MQKLNYKEILDMKINNDFSEFSVWTIRRYLKLLLFLVITEQEGFSGKRPFGNSGWIRDLYFPLVKNGVIVGTILYEPNGTCYLDSCDEQSGMEVIKKLIEFVFQEDN